MIEQPADIFGWSRPTLNRQPPSWSRGPLTDARAKVLDRKALWQARKQLTPPPMLPVKSKLAAEYGRLDGDAV
jgi:hypothetical protein